MTDSLEQMLRTAAQIASQCSRLVFATLSSIAMTLVRFQSPKAMTKFRLNAFCACLNGSLFFFSLARADEPKLVIVDNDFTGPLETLSGLRSALMFLENPNCKVLGFTVVTGDGWRNEEVAHLLRLEEIAWRSDVPPVMPGTVTPLVNTLQDTREWKKMFYQRFKI
jgi:hypothetical protein